MHKISETIDKSLHPMKCLQSIIEVVPRIYHMPFPTSENIQIISNYLNTAYGSNYFIWNISEESYDINAFNKQVFKFFFEALIKKQCKQRFLKIVSMDIQTHHYMKFLLYVFQ